MLYLDSALESEARAAHALGFVGGITTNPTLVTRAGRDPDELLRALCDITDGNVFYQLTADTVDARRAEAERVMAIDRRVGIKIPCTTENLALAQSLVLDTTVAMTTIFSPAQALLAVLARVHHIIPYVNRTTRLLGAGPDLVRQMRAVIDASRAGTRTRILAASIQSPSEAVAALLAGAHDMTLPLAVIHAMGEHELSDQAIQQFKE